MLLLCAGLAALHAAGSPAPSRYDVMLNDPWPTGCAVRSAWLSSHLPFSVPPLHGSCSSGRGSHIDKRGEGHLGPGPCAGCCLQRPLEV
jgi:hypothetical protein